MYQIRMYHTCRCTINSTAVSLFVYSLVGGGIRRTFRPWTHTSDDSYIYQLSLVVATATVSYSIFEVREYLGEIESDSQSGPAYALLYHGQCFRFSSPSLQRLTRFDRKSLCPLFRSIKFGRTVREVVRTYTCINVPD